MKAILFDLWGTLLDNSKSYFIKDALEAIGLELNEDTCRIFEETVMKKSFFDDDEMMKALVLRFGMELTPEIKAKLLRLLRMRNDESRLFDDVVEVLEDLKKDYMLILLSNTCSIDDIGAFERIRPLFDDIILSYDIGRLKPDKDAFVYVLQKHNLKPEEVIMVGDSRRTDAKSELLGIKAIIVDRFNKYRSNDCIKDLRPLRKKIMGE